MLVAFEKQGNVIKSITLEIQCPFCENIHSVNILEEDYFQWIGGGLAQDCFPYLSPTEREQLISHLCPNCQKSIFREEE